MKKAQPGGPKAFVIACSAAGILALSPAIASAQQQEKGEAASPPSAKQAPPQKAQPAQAERKSAPPAAKSQSASSPRASSESARGKSDGDPNANRNRGKQVREGKQAKEGRAKEQSQQQRAADSDENKTSKSQKRSKAASGMADRKDEARKKAQRNENAVGSDSGSKSGTSTAQPGAKSQPQSKDGVATAPGGPAGKSAEQQRTPQTPQTQPPRTKTGEATQGNAARPARLDDTQRVEIRRAILADTNVRRLNRPNFAVSIGTRIPRSVQLAIVPAALIAIVPAYRAYRYFVVDDRICIVEPNTYEIVEVIDDTGTGPGIGKRDQVAVLELNADQRRRIAVLARQGTPRADIRISLALGAEIPSGVMMFEFPADIVASIGDLRNYRYVLVEDKVVVAEPRTRVIVLVVDN